MYGIIQITEMAERIKKGLGDETRVFLFGSYAWGRANACSDVDFAVVVPDDKYSNKTSLTARKLSQNGIIPIDIVSYRLSTFNKSISGDLSYEIKTRGIEL